MSPRPKNDTDRRYALFALRIVGDFGASIAIPVIFFVLIGSWLDTKYGYTYTFKAIAFVVAALVTAKNIVKKAKRYGEEYEAIEKNGNEEHSETEAK